MGEREWHSWLVYMVKWDFEAYCCLGPGFFLEYYMQHHMDRKNMHPRPGTLNAVVQGRRSLVTWLGLRPKHFPGGKWGVGCHICASFLHQCGSQKTACASMAYTSCI